jgi:hypothetical protein
MLARAVTALRRPPAGRPSWSAREENTLGTFVNPSARQKSGRLVQIIEKLPETISKDSG